MASEPPASDLVEEVASMEGWLRKRSRHRGVFRDRWMVLTPAHVLISFRDERCLQPTERIELQHVTGITLGSACLTLATSRRIFVFRPASSAVMGRQAPSLLAWQRQLEAVRSRFGADGSLTARLPDELLARVFEELPISAIATISVTCRQWRNVRLDLLARQHRQAAAQIERFWSTDSRYHLATLRRHRPLNRAFPFFTLHVEHTGELLLRADRDRHGRGFVISCPVGGPAGKLDETPMQFVAHLCADASFTVFNLFDHGLPAPCPVPPRCEAGCDGGLAPFGNELERRELAHITLRHSMWAARNIAVALPAHTPTDEMELHVVSEGSAAAEAGRAHTGKLPANADEARSSSLERLPAPAPLPAPPHPAVPRRSLASRARRQQWSLGTSQDSSLCMLHNAVPAWNSELRAFTLPFFGRVHLASKKNFQLIDRRRPDVVVMIFGKSKRDMYALDWCAPLSCVQALGIALSSFDSCLSGSKL